MTGWSWLHVRKSIGRRNGSRAWQTTTNVSGWPDLAPLWNPRQPGRFLAIEIKVPPDKLSSEQAAVMGELAACGFETYVVTEADLEDLAKVLTPNGSAPTGSALSFGFAPTERTAQ